jgi:hypothetical protein
MFAPGGSLSLQSNSVYVRERLSAAAAERRTARTDGVDLVRRGPPAAGYCAIRAEAAGICLTVRCPRALQHCN